MDETYLKVAGQWVYLYRVIDQHGQVIDVLASTKRDLAATRRFFTQALAAARRPTEVTTDRAPAYPRVLDELVPEAWHVVEQYTNNPIETDHGQLKARTRPMRGLTRIPPPRWSVAGMRSSSRAADSGVMEHRVRRFWSSRSGSFGAVLRGVGRSVSDGSVAGSPPSGWVVDESARTGLV